MLQSLFYLSPLPLLSLTRKRCTTFSSSRFLKQRCPARSAAPGFRALSCRALCTPCSLLLSLGLLAMRSLQHRGRCEHTTDCGLAPFVLEASFAALRVSKNSAQHALVLERLVRVGGFDTTVNPKVGGFRVSVILSTTLGVFLIHAFVASAGKMQGAGECLVAMIVSRWKLTVRKRRCIQRQSSCKGVLRRLQSKHKSCCAETATKLQTPTRNCDSLVASVAANLLPPSLPTTTSAMTCSTNREMSSNLFQVASRACNRNA